MDEAHRLAADGAPDGAAVVAERMTAGRGSRGRPWLAPPGGLWLSVVRRPNTAPAAGVVALRVGLEVVGLIERLAPGLTPAIKWPNDIMIGDRKVAGILCEMRWQGAVPGWLVIGLGLNVCNRLPAELIGSAVTLANWVPDLTPRALEGPVLDRLRAIDTETSVLTDRELAAFTIHDWLAGRRLRLPPGATAAGIGSDGQLKVKDTTGVISTLSSAQSVELQPVVDSG